MKTSNLLTLPKRFSAAVWIGARSARDSARFAKDSSPSVSYVSRNNKGLLLVRDGQTLSMIPALSVAVIVTAPPYWTRGRASAARYARQLATKFAREWRRVLAADGDLWIIMGDRHDGKEWIGMDGLVADSFRWAGWILHAKGLWAEHPSSSRWDERINYILRFKNPGSVRLPPNTTLCWRLPLPAVPARSFWNGIPHPVSRKLLRVSPAGTVLDLLDRHGGSCSYTGRPLLDRCRARHR